MELEPMQTIGSAALQLEVAVEDLVSVKPFLARCAK